MSTATNLHRLILAVAGGYGLDASPHVLAAAARAGAVPVFDLAGGDAWTLRAFEQTARKMSGMGVRISAECAATPTDLSRLGGASVSLIVLAANSSWPVTELLESYEVLIEVTSVTEAREAVAAGAAGIVARGMESGGRVSDLSAFVLMQQLAAEADVPMWVAGGIGPRTAAAAVLGGAAGVLLDTQLLLLPESTVPDDLAGMLRRMDGTEVVSADGRRGLPRAGTLLPVGQDGWLAREFAERWSDTAAAVRGVRRSILDAVEHADADAMLRPGAPLAQALGVSLPVAQGPMTRVSDEAGFALAVADAGGLPFIALALANAQQTRRMLTEARAAFGDRPWGVGVLGFAPEEIRAAQLEIIREIRPRVAIIAGGRPAQAKGLEADGISSFLHVPSPGLLRQFLQSGSRKFIFEGAECGGHVGPRASFPLWEAQLTVLEEFLDGHDAAAAADLQLFFAGGIHDERSAAMVAAMAGPLTRRGVRAGVLMGTAYLFTAEAVTHGAIQPLFQQRAVEATGTALLESAPGHATRCLPSTFVDDFNELRTSLQDAGVDGKQVWGMLEQLNIGRLRIASKGIRRDGDDLIGVDETGQAAEGLFMAGQVAVLRHAVTTMADLHTQVTTGAAGLHAERVAAVRAGLGLNAAETPPVAPLDIAIVGMACVFPGSNDLAGFWNTVLSGADVIREVPRDRWDADTYYAPEVGPGQTGRITVSKWGGFIDPVPFDAIRYGIPPAALASIDPTQLLALEISHRALIDAGYAYDSGHDHARTGVVFGAEAGSDMSQTQTLRTLLPGYLGDVPEQLEPLLPTITEDTFPGVLANVIAGRVANRLDLGGPNFTVDAACASSLAAMDSACKELVTGGSDLMICGGADLHNGINDYLMFTSAHALSPTGKCRTFDSTGDGIALGEGVAAVVLKRLADAERDGDRVYAVVKGLGGASDGRALGLTAPRAEGQRRALDKAYAGAGVSPSQVGLVEAHGTGTVVGDRTELETLTRMFTDAGARPGAAVLGSVKSQIGHTKCAAGMAGVIKTALALHTGVRPPTINLTRPNPAWDPRTSPFAFHTEPRPWATPAEQRLAGVSAFGFGGTNFHVVLGAHAPTADPRHSREQWPAELFLFRGTTVEAARRAAQKLLDTVTTLPATVRLRDLAAASARDADPRNGPARVAVVARDVDDLFALLRRAVAGEHEPRDGLVQPPPADGPGKVAFLFPGQGSQRPGALADLFVAFPELRQYLELGREWADVLFPAAAFDEATEQEQADLIRDTRVAQPVLGIGGLAADHVLRRLGVRPDMAGGHSYGELVALCTSGAFDPATLLELSRERAAAILGAAGADPGTMAAVGATTDQLTAVLAAAGLTGQVVLANHNAPSQVVISGPTAAVARATAALKEAGLRARGIPVAAAFHSPVVAAAAETFAAVLADRPVAAPGIPVFSNAGARPYAADATAVRAGLAEQIGSPVRFVEQIEAMWAAGARIFVEAGPGQVLGKLVHDVLGDRPHQVVNVDGRPGQGLRTLLLAAAELACAGVAVQTGWLFSGRDAVATAAPKPGNRPVWTVDGQLVRDRNGDPLPGGMTPARHVEVTTMTASGAPEPVRDTRGDLVSEFLRTSRDLIATQRDVLLAYLGDGVPGGRMVWQPTEAAPVPVQYQPAPVPVQYQPAPVPVQYQPAPLEVAAPLPVVVPAAPVPVAVAVAVAVDVQGAVLTVISERTGYPEELIELDLDLEADLSVDSIKRAEVAGEVANRLGLSVEGDEAELEDLVKARTVRAMVAWLDSHINAPAATAQLAVLAPPAPVAVAVDVQGAVLTVISERTGYPEELIELDLDLEADLSVDSIKRAEVAGEVANRLGLSVEGDEAELEDLVKARTVRAMVAWLDLKINGTAVVAAVGATPAVAAAPATTRPGVAPQRLVGILEPAPAAAGAPALTGASFLITGGGAAGTRLAELLTQAGATAVCAGTGTDPAGYDGVVLLDGLTDDGTPLLPGLFSFVKDTLAAGPAWLIAAGPAGGGDHVDGLPGLFRTLAREYPAVIARYVEVSGDDTAAELFEELRDGQPAAIVHRFADGRMTEQLVPAGLGVLADGGAGPAGEGAAEAQAIGLDADSVVVLIGGARGITPWFGRAVAGGARCRIELVGRTPLPQTDEDPELAAAADKAALRAALARRGMRAPAEIDRTAAGILAAREVSATIAELEELGAQVRYHSLDVRDADATHRLIKQIHDGYGRLDGLVYAAGIIEDKLVADKDPASFERVFRTKVDGARAVLAALDACGAHPRFTVMFGSIAAAYGNRGQSDYAAANDALDSLAGRWSRAGGHRAVTVHWGPWAASGIHGGMVTAELTAEYARRGIGLIDPEDGALSLLRELAWGDSTTTSVVLTASGW